MLLNGQIFPSAGIRVMRRIFIANVMVAAQIELMQINCHRHRAVIHSSKPAATQMAAAGSSPAAAIRGTNGFLTLFRFAEFGFYQWYCHRYDWDQYYRYNNKAEMIFDKLDVPKEIAYRKEKSHPRNPTRDIELEKSFVSHFPDTRNKRGKCPYYRNETGYGYRHAAVLFKKGFRPVDIFHFNESDMFALFYPFAEHIAKMVIYRITAHSRDIEHQHGKRDIYGPSCRGEGRCGKNNGVSGQKRRYHKARFHENY
jgi:hypothetical protein